MDRHPVAATPETPTQVLVLSVKEVSLVETAKLAERGGPEQDYRRGQPIRIHNTGKPGVVIAPLVLIRPIPRTPQTEQSGRVVEGVEKTHRRRTQRAAGTQGAGCDGGQSGVSVQRRLQRCQLLTRDRRVGV